MKKSLFQSTCIQNALFCWLYPIIYFRVLNDPSLLEKKWNLDQNLGFRSILVTPWSIVSWTTFYFFYDFYTWNIAKKYFLIHFSYIFPKLHWIMTTSVLKNRINMFFFVILIKNDDFTLFRQPCNPIIPKHLLFTIFL